MTDGLPHCPSVCMVAFWHVISLWRAGAATAAEIRVKFEEEGLARLCHHRRRRELSKQCGRAGGHGSGKAKKLLRSLLFVTAEKSSFFSAIHHPLRSGGKKRRNRKEGQREGRNEAYVWRKT